MIDVNQWFVGGYGDCFSGYEVDNDFVDQFGICCSGYCIYVFLGIFGFVQCFGDDFVQDFDMGVGSDFWNDFVKCSVFIDL